MSQVAICEIPRLKLVNAVGSILSRLAFGGSILGVSTFFHLSATGERMSNEYLFTA